MLIGKVVGTVVASRKEEKLEGVKLLVLKQVNVEAQVGAATSSPSTRWAQGWTNTCSTPAGRRHARPW